MFLLFVVRLLLLHLFLLLCRREDILKVYDRVVALKKIKTVLRSVVFPPQINASPLMKR